MPVYYAIKNGKQYLQEKEAWDYGPLRSAYLFVSYKVAEKNIKTARKLEPDSTKYERVVAVQIEELP